MKAPTSETATLLAQRLVEMGFNDMTAGERRVIERVAKRVAVSRNIYAEQDQASNFGERLADQVASFGGSWTFLMAFGAFIVAWVGLNAAMLASAFDPYP